MRATFYLIPGQVFIDLTFIRELSPRERNSKLRIGLFRCVCGNERLLPFGNVISGRTKSCGCFNSKIVTERNSTHNLSKTPIYKKWCMILYRCENKNAKTYPNYGGKGISVSKDWHDFRSFYDDMHESYEAHIKLHGKVNTTIERIDYTKGYSKENCRWATPGEQANNTSRNRILLWEGKAHTLSQLAREKGLKPTQLEKRLRRGWSIERALSTPIL